MNFPNLVKKELKSPREEHGSIKSLHEGYAILLEEIDEFWEHVRQKRNNRDHNKILHELTQIGAMAQAIAEDIIKPQ
jgi:hypothetical protein